MQTFDVHAMGCGVDCLFRSSSMFKSLGYTYTDSDVLTDVPDVAQAAPAAAAPLALGAPTACQHASSLHLRAEPVWRLWRSPSARLSITRVYIEFCRPQLTGGSLFGGSISGLSGALWGSEVLLAPPNTLSSQPSRKGKGRK